MGSSDGIFILGMTALTAVVLVWAIDPNPRYEIGDCFGYNKQPVIGQVMDRLNGMYVVDFDPTAKETLTKAIMLPYQLVDNGTSKIPCPQRYWKK